MVNKNFFLDAFFKKIIGDRGGGQVVIIFPFTNDVGMP